MLENSVSQLVERIDNLVCHKIAYMYKELNRRDSAYFSGMLDAYYWFAYNISDDLFDRLTIQDAIDAALDDITEFADNSNYASSYYRGVVKASNEIVETVSRFVDDYYMNMYGDYPIKHILSTLNVYNFNINMQW